MAGYAQTGPLTKDTASLALGLAQIRVAAAHCTAGSGAGAVYVSGAMLSGANSIGAIASTRLTIEREYYTHEAGFPLLEDMQLPIREKAQLECAFEEVKVANMMLAAGKSPSDTGAVLLGGLKAPVFVRMEAVYQFPTNSKMVIIFPRAQVVSNTEIEFQKEQAANVPITFKAGRAESGIISGGQVSWGSSVWDTCPLGQIYFAASGTAADAILE
jgi:hypothetical protein